MFVEIVSACFLKGLHLSSVACVVVNVDLCRLNMWFEYSVVSVELLCFVEWRHSGTLIF